MQQYTDRAGKDGVRASTGGISSLDFTFLDDFDMRTETLEGTTEPAEEETSTLEPPSAFMDISRTLPESSSPGKFKTTETKLLLESPRRRRIEGTVRVPFLGTSPEEEWEIHQRGHESRTGCNMDRVAFIEEVWMVVQCYGTHSLLKSGLNRPLMREILDKLDECEGTLSELLYDSATDEKEVNHSMKPTQQEGGNEIVYLSRTQKGTMLVIDKINDMKTKFGSKMTLRKNWKAKVDSQISVKAVNSAK